MLCYSMCTKVSVYVVINSVLEPFWANYRYRERMQIKRLMGCYLESTICKVNVTKVAFYGYLCI